MSETTERFIRVYEELFQEVNRRAKASSHSLEIELASSRDGAVRKHASLLRYIRDIRNTIQHPGHRSRGPAVTVSPHFLEEVQQLLNHLRNPPTARSVGVPRAKIKIASLTDRLGDLAEEMKRRGFSHLPILDENDAVIGVFNEAAVFDHLWADSETIISRDMQVKDILPHCRLDSKHTETFDFVSPRETLDDLINKFTSIQTTTARVGAVFVTASGKLTEPLQRLITPWDVLATSAD